MLIDFHTHAFPDKIAAGAISKLAGVSQKTPQTDGTVSGLIKMMDLWKVDLSVICNIATNPRQESKVNSFAIETSKNYPRVVALGSINPNSSSIESEILRLKEAGIPGIKIHPDYMEKTLDSPEFDIIFELCSQNDLFVVTHAGVDDYSPDFVHATPDMILGVIKRFPDLKLVAAHLGGNLMWEEVADKLCGTPVFIDTSLACAPDGVAPKTAERIIKTHDPERILFGSDAPWRTVDKCREFIDRLKISSNLKEKIFESNAKRLLNI